MMLARACRRVLPCEVQPGRVGQVATIRVYYDVEDEPGPTVVVLAVGLKKRNRLRIGGEEIEL